MTLLELLLALTIMASVMGLLGAMMAQARGWTDRSVEDEGLMHLQRIGEAMRTQWADRRTAVKLDDSGKAVTSSSTELSFVTATALLFPDWPLVMATYRIEPDTAHVSSSGLLWRLVYVETRIAGMDQPPSDYALDAQGRSMRDSIILLDGCADLHWERFGRAKDAEKRAENNADGEGDSPDAGDRADKTADPTSRTASNQSRTDPARQPQPATGANQADTTVAKEDMLFLWRPMEDDLDGYVPAMRLVGNQNREQFGWVFVIRALR